MQFSGRTSPYSCSQNLKCNSQNQENSLDQRAFASITVAHTNCCRPPCQPPYRGLPLDCCVRCRRVVYLSERKEFNSCVWHTFCFSCLKCRRLLDSCSANTHKGEVYCNSCYEAVTTCPKCQPCRSPIEPFCTNPCDLPEFCCDELHHQQHHGPRCTECASGGLNKKCNSGGNKPCGGGGGGGYKTPCAPKPSCPRGASSPCSSGNRSCGKPQTNCTAPPRRSKCGGCGSTTKGNCNCYPGSPPRREAVCTPCPPDPCGPGPPNCNDDACIPCCCLLPCKPCNNPCCGCCCKPRPTCCCPPTRHYKLRPARPLRYVPPRNACLDECDIPTGKH